MISSNWMREPAMLLMTALVAAVYLYGYGDKITRSDLDASSNTQITLSSSVEPRLIR